MIFQMSWLHSRFEMNHIVNENFLFSKRIVPFQKGQLVAFPETERLRNIFYSVVVNSYSDVYKIHRILK